MWLKLSGIRPMIPVKKTNRHVSWILTGIYKDNYYTYM